MVLGAKGGAGEGEGAKSKNENRCAEICARPTNFVFKGSPSVRSTQRPGVFLVPPGRDATPSQGYPYSIKFTRTHLYTWVERGKNSMQFPEGRSFSNDELKLVERGLQE